MGVGVRCAETVSLTLVEQCHGHAVIHRTPFAMIRSNTYASGRGRLRGEQQPDSGSTVMSVPGKHIESIPSPSAVVSTVLLSAKLSMGLIYRNPLNHKRTFRQLAGCTNGGLFHVCRWAAAWG